jgi:hypothetical protein
VKLAFGTGANAVAAPELWPANRGGGQTSTIIMSES